MGGPGQVTADGDAQVLAGTCCFQCLPMGKVAGCQDLCFLGMLWMTLRLHLLCVFPLTETTGCRPVCVCGVCMCMP